MCQNTEKKTKIKKKLSYESEMNENKKRYIEEYGEINEKQENVKDLMHEDVKSYKTNI